MPEVDSDDESRDPAFCDRRRRGIARGGPSVLIYADDMYGRVYIYDYFTGKQVGRLAGVVGGFGMCVDAKGDVYVGESDGSTYEYAHGGTKVLNTYKISGTPHGCSVDAKRDLAITSAPGSVTVFAGADPSKGKTYGSSDCRDMFRMGYDDKGNLVGLEAQKSPFIACAVLAGAKRESTLSLRGFTIGVPSGTMWDGKYIALGDQRAYGSKGTGIVQASLTGTTLTSHHETVFDDTCGGGYAQIASPFVLGAKNTPVNDRQGRVVVGVDLLCTAAGIYQIELWHYPKGGKPFKIYKVDKALGSVAAVSIGS